MKKIVTIVGARPQFIKCAPVSSELMKHFKEIIVHTGQHYDHEMSGSFFDELCISEPYYNLEVGSLSHAKQTGQMLSKIEDVLLSEKPDLVLVYGDTNSTLAGALTAVKMNIPVAHIEAGLRSFNNDMPEEINRILTDRISSILFVSSNQGMENLQNEGLTDHCFFTGDVMIDVLKDSVDNCNDVIDKFNVTKQGYYFATFHRPYNVDDEKILRQIVNAFNSLDKRVLFSVHPRTLKRLSEFNIEVGDNLVLLSPVSYLESISLQKNAKKVITDSGGIQKEAHFLGVPCVTLRPETEWTETVNCGANVLVKTRNSEDILKAINLEQSWKFEPFYGDGNASYLITEKIEAFLNGEA